VLLVEDRRLGGQSEGFRHLTSVLLGTPKLPVKAADLWTLTQRRQAILPMNENMVAKAIVDAAFKVHKSLGPGLLESVYERVLAYELDGRGLYVQRQLPIPIVYESITFDEGFRADLIVEDKVIVELKSVETVAPVHKKQLQTYLRLADKRLGLLINFGSEFIRDGITRVVNGLKD
jgi:GxxExxY protein